MPTAALLVRVPLDVKAWLEAESARTGAPQAELIRRALVAAMSPSIFATQPDPAVPTTFSVEPSGDLAPAPVTGSPPPAPRQVNPIFPKRMKK